MFFALTVSVLVPFFSVSEQVMRRLEPEPVVLQVPDFRVAPVLDSAYDFAPVTGRNVAVSDLPDSFHVTAIDAYG